MIATQDKIVDKQAILLVDRLSLAMPGPRHLPSLDTLLALVQDERSKQIAHFDALDGKAGIALGFAGLLITLAPDVPPALLVPGLAAAGTAASFALSAFWPRPHATLRPTPMRKYLAADDRFTRVRVFDTLEVLVNALSYDLATKGRRLRRALMALGIAATLFAAGTVVAAFEGGDNVGPASRASPASAGTTGAGP